MVGLVAGICLAHVAWAASWVSVGYDHRDGECYYLNTARLAGDSYSKVNREAVAWVKTTKPDFDVSLQELIRFHCADRRYSLIRRYRVTADGHYYRSTGSTERVAESDSPALELLNNVCRQVEHIASGISAGQSDPAPLPMDGNPACNR